MQLYYANDLKSTWGKTERVSRKEETQARCSVASIARIPGLEN